MADLPEKHALARRLIRGCEDALVDIERSGAGAGSSKVQDLDKRVAELKSVVSGMETILSSAFNMPVRQRNEWKRKVGSNVTAAAELEVSVRTLKGRLQRQEVQDAERASLMSGASTTRADVDRDGRMLRNVRQSNRTVEEMLDQAAGVLAGMGATRERLKRTQRKLLDMANSVGISDRILKMADRRNKGDALLVYGGMATVTVIVVIVLFWWS